MPLIETEMVGSTGLQGETKKKFHWGHVKLEILIRHPRGDAKLVVRYMSLQGKEAGWRYRFGRHQHIFGT